MQITELVIWKLLTANRSRRKVGVKKLRAVILMRMVDALTSLSDEGRSSLR